MAASQARLLTLTARLHDVEYQAQSIQNAKIQLSTQSDQVYQEYLDALDATTLTIKNYDGELIPANFNNMFGPGKVDTKYNYALKDDHGKLVVTDDVYNAYQEYITHKEEYPQDAYSFALYMQDPNNVNPSDLDGDEGDVMAIYEEIINDPDEVKKGTVQELQNIQKSMDELLEKGGEDGYNGLDDENMKKYDELEQAFKNKIYSAYADKILAKNTGENSVEDANFKEDDFKYYASIFKQIELAGGCVPISDYDGFGDAASDSEFLKDMIECGKFTVDIVSEDKNGNVSFSGTSPSSDSFLGYTTTTTIDKAALAKAEAKYQHETKVLDQKDKKFDMDLSKLDTERQAITKQMDSVKTVIKDNIERTFGIFS